MNNNLKKIAIVSSLVLVVVLVVYFFILLISKSPNFFKAADLGAITTTSTASSPSSTPEPSVCPTPTCPSGTNAMTGTDGKPYACCRGKVCSLHYLPPTCCNTYDDCYINTLFGLNNAILFQTNACCAPNGTQSQVINKSDGTQDCCKSPAMACKFAVGKVQKCCASNETCYKLSGGDGACCPEVKDGVGDYRSAVCTNPGTGAKTCCNDKQTCNQTTGKCVAISCPIPTNITRCCICQYGTEVITPLPFEGPMESSCNNYYKTLMAPSCDSYKVISSFTSLSNSIPSNCGSINYIWSGHGLPIDSPILDSLNQKISDCSAKVNGQIIVNALGCSTGEDQNDVNSLAQIYKNKLQNTNDHTTVYTITFNQAKSVGNVVTGEQTLLTPETITISWPLGVPNPIIKITFGSCSTMGGYNNSCASFIGSSLVALGQIARCTDPSTNNVLIKKCCPSTTSDSKYYWRGISSDTSPCPSQYSDQKKYTITCTGSSNMCDSNGEKIDYVKDSLSNMYSNCTDKNGKILKWDDLANQCMGTDDFWMPGNLSDSSSNGVYTVTQTATCSTYHS